MREESRRERVRKEEGERHTSKGQPQISTYACVRDKLYERERDRERETWTKGETSKRRVKVMGGSNMGPTILVK